MIPEETLTTTEETLLLSTLPIKGSTAHDAVSASANILLAVLRLKTYRYYCCYSYTA